MLTASSYVIADALTVRFNGSVTESQFPSILKTSHVTPVHKKGNKETCTNYRPVSLLIFVGKVLEKMCANMFLNT